MFTKPLFRWQEVINFEDYEASLQADDCFAIKESHFKLEFNCYGNDVHLSCNLWEPLLLQTISKVILLSNTIVFYFIDTFYEPTTEHEGHRDVCKQGPCVIIEEEKAAQDDRRFRVHYAGGN